MNARTHDAGCEAAQMAICEQEQALIGWQLKGAPGSAEFAASSLRRDSASFAAPHDRIQAAIFEAVDAGRVASPATIAAALPVLPINDRPLADYLREIAGGAPATISADDTQAQMLKTLRAWRHLQGPTPKEGSVELVRGDAVDPAPVNWIWPGWLAAGKLHILGGQAGTGKTTIAVTMAATLSSGAVFPDGTRAPVGDTLIWSGEDDFRDSLLPRFMANGGLRERIYHVKGRHDENGNLQPFDPALDVDALVTAAGRLPDLKLIVIDPVVSTVQGDSHKNAEVRRAMQPLVSLAEQANAAILGITHFSKGTSGRHPIERITGSLAFTALPRLVWCTAKPHEQGAPSRLVRVKSNIGPDGGGFEYDIQQMIVDQAKGISGQAIVWGAALEGDARTLIAEIEAPQEAGRTSALDAAKSWLMDILGTGPVAATDIEDAAREADHSWTTVNRAKSALGIKPVKRGTAGGWVWNLPKAAKTGEDAQRDS